LGSLAGGSIQPHKATERRASEPKVSKSGDCDAGSDGGRGSGGTAQQLALCHLKMLLLSAIPLAAAAW